MKKIFASMVAAAAFIGFVGSASAQVTCAQYTTAGTAIHGQFSQMMAGQVTPQAAVTSIVGTIQQLSPRPEDAAEMKAAVDALGKAGYPKDAVANALKTKLEPTFRARATAAGCTLPPLPQG